MPSYPTNGLIARLDFTNPSCFTNGGTAVTNLAAGGSNWTIANTSYTYNANFGTVSFDPGNPLTSNTLNPFGNGNVPYTIAFWHFYPTSGARDYIYYNGYYYPNPMHIVSDPTNNEYEIVYQPGLTTAYNVPTKKNRYNHICVTYDHTTTTSTFYINGVVAGTLVYQMEQGISPSGYPGVQFNDPWNNTGVDPIGYIYLYNRCISPAEVLDIYNNDSAGFVKVVDLDFSNSSSFSGSGLTVYDLSNYDNDFYLGDTDYIFSNGDGGELYTDTINLDTTFRRSPLSGFGYSTDPFTAHIWVKLDAYNAINTTQIWCANFTGGAGNPHNNIFLGASGASNLLFFTDGSDTCPTSYPIDLYRWYLISLVKPDNGATDDCKLFVNGTQVGFGGSTGTPINLYGGAQIAGQNPNVMAFGGAYANQPVWNSEQTTGQFAFYNIAQSDADVLSFYNNTKARFDNLVALYDFSDPACYSGSGNTVYDLEKNNNLTINNSPFTADGDASYFSFNGSNQYIYNSNFPGLGNTFTMNVWARPEPGSLDDVIINGGKDSSGQMPAISIGWYAGPTYGVPFAHFNYGVGYRPGTAYIPNEFQMFTFTADGTTVSLYQNGVSVGSTSQGGGTWGSRADFLSGFALGTALNSTGGPQVSEVFLGDIAYASVYNTALGSTAVNNLYNSLSSRFSTDPQILKYDFSDPACYPGTGNTVYDLSTQGLDGTIASLGVGVTYVPNGQQSYFQWNTSAQGYIQSEVYDNTSPQLFSLLVWTKISTITQGCIISTAEFNSPGGVPFIYVNDPYAPGNVRVSNGYNYGSITSPVQLNKWKMYVYTYDGSNMKLYVDGSLAGTDPIGGIAAISGTQPYVRLGQYSGVLDGTFNNQIAYAEVYRGKALSAGEVATIYNNTYSRFAEIIPITGSNVGGRSFGKGLNG